MATPFFHLAMPTYIYETIPESAAEKPQRFEVRQSMNDRPLRRHPETGQPVQRVITGGFGYLPSGSDTVPPPAPGGG